MTMLRIEIDPEVCMGAGPVCLLGAGDVRARRRGLARVIDVDGDTEEKIVLGAKGCPTGAIAVWRDDERLV